MGIIISMWVLLGVSSRPFERSFEVAVLAYFIRRFDVERRALGMFSCCRVVGVVREIVIHEKGIIRPCPFDACLLVRLAFSPVYGGLRLYVVAPLFPPFGGVIYSCD